MRHWRNGHERLDKGELKPLARRSKENPYLDYAVNSPMIRIHYIDVIGVVNLRRCYHKEHPVSYPEALAYAQKLCALATEQFGGMSSEGAYDFITPFLDYGMDISFEEGGSGICDKAVPFWQLVYHGTVLSNPYVGTVNATFKGRDNFLKMIEYGGRPTFYYYSAFMGNGNNWMGNQDCRCDNQQQLKESVGKIEEAVDAYDALGAVRFAEMQKHRQVAENVYEITYSNGTVVVVDYVKKEYRVIPG